MKHTLTFGDKILIGSLLLLSLLSFPLISRLNHQGTRVQIETDGRVYKVVSLDRSQRLAVPGPLGDTIVSIQDGKVAVVESPCRAKICIKTGRISRVNQLSVCIPNKVIVRILGDDEGAYDAVTQ